MNGILKSTIVTILIFTLMMMFLLTFAVLAFVFPNILLHIVLMACYIIGFVMIWGRMKDFFG